MNASTLELVNVALFLEFHHRFDIKSQSIEAVFSIQFYLNHLYHSNKDEAIQLNTNASVFLFDFFPSVCIQQSAYRYDETYHIPCEYKIW